MVFLCVFVQNSFSSFSAELASNVLLRQRVLCWGACAIGSLIQGLKALAAIDLRDRVNYGSLVSVRLNIGS